MSKKRQTPPSGSPPLDPKIRRVGGLRHPVTSIPFSLSPSKEQRGGKLRHSSHLRLEPLVLASPSEQDKHEDLFEERRLLSKERQALDVKCEDFRRRKNLYYDLLTAKAKGLLADREGLLADRSEERRVGKEC